MILRAIFDHLPEALLVCDDDGRIVEANAAAGSLLGASPSALVGQRAGTVIADEALWTALRRDGHARVERLTRAPSGDERWIEWRAAAKVAPGYDLIVGRDVSGRRLAEEERRVAEQQLRVVLDHAPIVIFATDRHGIFTVSAGRGLESTGLVSSEILGTSAFDAFGDVELVTKEGPLTCRDVLRRILDEGATFEGMTQLGETIFDNRFGPLRDDDGAVVGMFGVATDVTERERNGDALRASEQLFRTLVEHSSDSIVLQTADGTILDVSPSTERILGYSHAELVGHHPVETLHPDDLPRVKATFERMVAQPGEAVTADAYRVRHKSGRWLWMEGTAKNLLGEPTVRAIVVNQRDVTSRKLLEEQFLQAQKMEAIGRLAGGVAHDVNNMLAAIQSFTTIAMAGLPDGPTVKADLRQVLEAVDRAASLTRQLLAFGRKQVLNPEPLDVNDLVSNVDRMLRRVIGEDIELRTELTDGPAIVKADRGQLEQVLVNLAVNARDAMPGGGRLTITVDGHPSEASGSIDGHPGGYVCLRVCDTGTGIDPSVQSRMFEPFFSTKRAGKGTGLGLSTVYGIVKQSGGHVAVRSEPGAGATFEVYLPRSDEAPPRPPSDRPAPRPRRGSETVLVAEDEPLLRKVVTRLLALEGYRVLEACDGREALDIGETRGHEIDLLLTDVIMPRMGGAELNARLRSRFPRVRVVFMSGYEGDFTFRDEALPGPFVQKPFATDVLLRAIRETLDA